MSAKPRRKDASRAAPDADADADVDADDDKSVTAPNSAPPAAEPAGSGAADDEEDGQAAAARLILDTKARGPGITDAVAGRHDVFEDLQDVNVNPEAYAMRDDTTPDTSHAPRLLLLAAAVLALSAVYRNEPLPLVGLYPAAAVPGVVAAAQQCAQWLDATPGAWLLASAAPLLLYCCYAWCWRPLEYERKLALKPARRAVASLPPPYPNGWFKVADSRDLAPGALKSLRVLGQELVLFRGYGNTAYHSDGTAVTHSRHTLDHKDSAKERTGDAAAAAAAARQQQPPQQAVHVLDAFCPHLGANLAVGGKVTGDCVECPFHGWLFRGADGQCTHIPYSNGSIPAAAKTRSWPVREVNGCVYLWHDVDGRPPSWEPVPFAPPTGCGQAQYTTSPGSGAAAHVPGGAPRRAGLLARLFGCNGGLRYHGRTRHYVAAHVQEIPENGVDTAHFAHLHTPLLGRLLRWQWHAVWAPSTRAGEQHVTNMQIDTRVAVCGLTIPGVKFSCVIQQIGPGLVHLNFGYWFGRLMCVESVTPMAPLLQRCEHTMFADWWVPRFIPKLVLKILSAQFERDVPIWSHKRLLAKPTLVKEDGRVVPFRRWYKQFYQSDSGLKRREALDW